MTQTLSITQARGNLTKLVDNAHKKLHEYIITVNGAPAAIIIPFSEYESIKETNEILADKALMKAIRQGEKEIREGKGENWEDVKKELGFE